jgi:hypothetical protein
LQPQRANVAQPTGEELQQERKYAAFHWPPFTNYYRNYNFVLAVLDIGLCKITDNDTIIFKIVPSAISVKESLSNGITFDTS